MNDDEQAVLNVLLTAKKRRWWSGGNICDELHARDLETWKAKKDYYTSILKDLSLLFPFIKAADKRSNFFEPANWFYVDMSLLFSMWLAKQQAAPTDDDYISLLIAAGIIDD